MGEGTPPGRDSCASRHALTKVSWVGTCPAVSPRLLHPEAGVSLQGKAGRGSKANFKTNNGNRNHPVPQRERK